jgi:hypothetical protein
MASDRLGQPVVTAPVSPGALDAVTVRVARTVDELDAAVWDSLCGPDDYFTAAYLQALTRSEMDCSFRFLLAEADGAAVGLGFGYIFSPPLAGPLKIRIFSTGTPTDIGFPFVVRASVPPAPVLDALIRAAIDAADDAKAAAILVRDVVDPRQSEECEAIFDTCQLRGFPVFAEAMLPITWATFDDYLASLRRPYRKGINTRARKVLEAGYEFEVVSGADAVALAAELQPLWMQVYARFPDDFDQLVLPEAYFREVLALPGSVLFLLRHEGRLVGFDNLRENGSVLDSKFCGRDYARIGQLPVGHFMMAETIRYACDNGFAMLSFGITNESVKSRYGCMFRVIHGYRRPISAPLRLARVLRLERFLVRGYDVEFAMADSSQGHVFRDPDFPVPAAAR